MKYFLKKLRQIYINNKEISAEQTNQEIKEGEREQICDELCLRVVLMEKMYF